MFLSPSPVVVVVAHNVIVLYTYIGIRHVQLQRRRCARYRCIRHARCGKFAERSLPRELNIIHSAPACAYYIIVIETSESCVFINGKVHTRLTIFSGSCCRRAYDFLFVFYSRYVSKYFAVYNNWRLCKNEYVRSFFGDKSMYMLHQAFTHIQRACPTERYLSR